MTTVSKSKQYLQKTDHPQEEGDISFKILNKDGGYVSVVIRPSGEGYIGPQGEYYDEFPNMDHLKVIYGS